MSGSVCEVIITADDESWLLEFTRALVRDRLVACHVRDLVGGTSTSSARRQFDSSIAATLNST